MFVVQHQHPCLSHSQVHMAAISSLQNEVESLNQKLGEVTRQQDAREAMASQR